MHLFLVNGFDSPFPAGVDVFGLAYDAKAALTQLFAHGEHRLDDGFIIHPRVRDRGGLVVLTWSLVHSDAR